MAFEGTENKEFIRDYYTGKVNLKIASINPTAQEKVDILGWSKKPETEPVYTGERDGVQTARVEVNFLGKEGEKFSHSFFVENKEVVSKAGDKVQHVNVFGQFSYLPLDGSIPENLSWFSTEGLRKSFKGEEELVSMLMAWKDTRKGQKFSFSNFSDMFKGNFSEVKSLTSNNSVGTFTGVKQTFGDDGVVKYTQVLYPKLFVKQYTKAEDSPNKTGGTYKGWVNAFTEAIEGTRNAGGQLNVNYGEKPYTFTKVELAKLSWLQGDNAGTSTTATKAEPAF